MAGDQGMEASALALNPSSGAAIYTSCMRRRMQLGRQRAIAGEHRSMCRSSRPTIVRHDPIAAVAQVWPGSIWINLASKMAKNCPPLARTLLCGLSVSLLLGNVCVPASASLITLCSVFTWPLYVRLESLIERWGSRQLFLSRKLRGKIDVFAEELPRKSSLGQKFTTRKRGNRRITARNT